MQQVVNDDCITIKRLISDKELHALSQEHCVLGQGEIPFLIKLLWNIRDFQEEAMALPINRLEPLIFQLWQADEAIALQILQLRENC